MDIKTEFNPGQEVFLMEDNKILMGKIMVVYVSANSGSTNICYNVHREGKGTKTNIKESELFATKETLIKSL